MGRQGNIGDKLSGRGNVWRELSRWVNLCLREECLGKGGKVSGGGNVFGDCVEGKVLGKCLQS